MRAGKLDRRIKLQKLVAGRDDFNEPINEWATFATVGAQQRPNRGAERLTAKSVVGNSVMTFHIRWRDDLSDDDRVFYKGKAWNVLDIREVGRRKVLEIDVAALAQKS